MAQSLSDEQIQLRGKARRRLVGAIALVLVISAVLPMVLDNKPKPASQDIAIDIPKQDAVGFAPAAPPIGSVVVPPPPAVQPTPVIPSPVAVVPAEKPAAEAPPKPTAAKPVEKAVEEPAAKPADKPAEKSPAKSEKPQDKKPAADKPVKADKPAEPAKNGGFVVQLGAFSNAENAKQLQSKLAANRIKVYSDTLKSPSGDKVRVRAGPYASREEADKALAKIKQLGLDGKVVPK
jgi:DedD protein